jgi:hypothetical protein
MSIPCLRSFRMLLASDHLKHIHPRSTFELHCCESARICQLKIIHHSFYKKTQISNVDSLFRCTHCHGESCAVFCICLFVNTNTCNYSCLWDPNVGSYDYFNTSGTSIDPLVLPKFKFEIFPESAIGFFEICLKFREKFL